jgi:hypothetical protein
MNDPPRPGRSLTRRQFDEVIRRASELALGDMDGENGEEMSEAEVYRIAREVGLSESHVRKALAEVDTGSSVASMAQPTTWWNRFWGAETIRVTRVVPGSANSVAEKIDGYMVGGRLLQPVRRSPSFLQYRPAVDWMSQVARAASGTARRYYVASAKSVEVDLEPVDEHRTHVGLSVDAGVRGNYVSGGLIGGTIAGGAAGVGAFLGITTAGMGIPLAVAAVAITVGLGVAGVSKVAANSHRAKVLEVQAELEGALDMLEAGGQPEPPPPAWRKWIERRFHGARRLLETEDPPLMDFRMDDDEP